MAIAFYAALQLLWVATLILVLLIPNQPLMVAGLAVIVMILNNSELILVKDAKNADDFHAVKMLSYIAMNYICVAFIVYAVFVNYRGVLPV